MKYQFNDGLLVFYFSDELDNMKIQQIRDTCADAIAELKPNHVLFDFKEVTFVDSTGIGFVLARYKQCQKQHCELSLRNLSKNNRSLFAMSGIFQLIREELSEGNL